MTACAFCGGSRELEDKRDWRETVSGGHVCPACQDRARQQLLAGAQAWLEQRERAFESLFVKREGGQ